MIELVQAGGALLGFLAVLIGAFGAHRLKKSLSESHLQNIETGVRYQFLHALLLLILGYNLPFTTSLDYYISGAVFLGTLLFSFSIYTLTFLSVRGMRIPFLGLLTPLGGLLLLLGWGLLLYDGLKNLV